MKDLEQLKKEAVHDIQSLLAAHGYLENSTIENYIDQAVSATRQETITKVLKVKPDEVGEGTLRIEHKDGSVREVYQEGKEAWNIALQEWEQNIKSLDT